MDNEIRDFSNLNLDEQLAAIALDEREDAPLISPVDYAKLRGNMTPQIVYYHMRKGHIDTIICPCGRKTVKREEADSYFRKIGKLPDFGGNSDESDEFDE